MKCGKLIKRGVMIEKRPCIRERGHKGGHGGGCSPDLAETVFGNFRVTSKPPCISSRGEILWTVKNIADDSVYSVAGSKLTNGDIKGLRSHLYSRNKVKNPVYASVHSHWYSIYKSVALGHHVYKNMPFCDDWNPDKGGAFWKGAKWITDNLGPKPSPAWSLDIIKHEIGFMPGNLRWALRNTQRRNQKHRTLGQWTDEEFFIEARKRGFILTKKE